MQYEYYSKYLEGATCNNDYIIDKADFPPMSFELIVIMSCDTHTEQMTTNQG